MATPRPLAILLLLLAVSAGCSGSARINLVSLNMKDIDPPPTQTWQFDAGECFWWLDENGDLNVAMRSERNDAFLGKFGRVEMCVSFVLDEPPAGSGRNYSIRQREVRAVAVTAMQSHRFTSFTGIVGISTEPREGYRGSFRVWMNSHSEMSLFTVLPNRPGTLLCFGTFSAVHDEQRGRAIRDRTEVGGFARPGKPRTFGGTTTQPMSTTQPVVSDAPVSNIPSINP